MQLLGRRYGTGRPVQLTIAGGRLAGIRPVKPGDRADLVVFDLGEGFEVRATLAAGEVVFGSLDTRL